MGLRELVFEGDLVAYRLIEYKKDKGIQFITENINIMSLPDSNRYYGKFKR